MDSLVSQLAIYLVAMGLLGLVLGWWIGASGGRQRSSEAIEKAERRVQATDVELEESALEIGRLADQLAQSKIQFEEARELTRRTGEELSAAREHLEAERQRVASFEPLLTKRDNKLEQARAERTELLQRLAATEQEQRQGGEYVRNLTIKLSAAVARASELEAVAARAEDRINELSTEVAERHELAAENERLRQLEQENGRLRDKESQRDASQETARLQLDDAGRERDRLVAELATLSNRLEQTELEHASHDRAAEAARLELEAQRDKLQRRDERIAALSDSGVRRSELEIEVQDLQAELDVQGDRLERRDERIAALEDAGAERSQLEVEAGNLKVELEAQRDKLRQRDARIAALEESSAARSELELEVESLRAELRASVRRVEDLQQRSSTAEAARLEAESERDRVQLELESLLSTPLIDVDRMATAKAPRFEAGDEADAGNSPDLLEVPHGAADDLRRIRGIGDVLARTLNELGIYHFSQIAGWSESDIQWVAAHIDTFPDRIVRDGWREQAADLARQTQGRRA